MAELIPLAELVERQIGHRPSPPTLWRWTHKGAGGVKLKASRVGAKWYSTLDDWQNFVREQTEAALRDSDSSAERSAQTERALSDAGLLDSGSDHQLRRRNTS